MPGMLHPRTLVVCLLFIAMYASPLLAVEPGRPILFSTNFEGASIGKIETVGPAHYRCYVVGQYDERGRNRQTTWYSFRVDQAKGREVTLVLTDFVGEYNDKPGACPMRAGLNPVFSEDGQAWKHFAAESANWDDVKKELTLKFTPGVDRFWIAHIPPYTTADLARVLADTSRSPHVTIETIGKTCGGRDIPLVTVTDLSVPDQQKKTLWLQSRQHAWEAGTSRVMDSALRFITSDDAAAVEIRKGCVLKFTPMLDLDGVAGGKVRFNANGLDVNRHWDVVDLRDPKWLALTPEVWYAKKAILAEHARKPIDLMVNMHNTETAEYVQTMSDDEGVLKRMRRFEDLLVERTGYDPSQRLTVGKAPSNTTNCLWMQAKVPIMLMEQRIGPSKKLGRQPTAEDRADYGKALIRAMAEAVK